MSLDKPVLRSHKPTGAVPAPFVLLEGEEKAGKTWAAVKLSASDKVGPTYFLDLGEGTAEEYAAIPGADYEVIDHDGTYASVLEQVLAVRGIAAAAKAAGQPPVVLIIDSMTDIWDGLKDWVGERAKAKPANQRKLAADPAAELDVSRNLWNDAGNRYRRLLNVLLTFPGIVVGTAKGKYVSATDPSTGQPYRDARREYKVDGEKNLAYAATAWVRMTRDEPPLVVGARSVHVGLKPGKDKPKPITHDPANLLEWLIFDTLRFDPAAGEARQLRNLTGGDLTEDEKVDAAAVEAAEREAGARPPRTTQRRDTPPAENTPPRAAAAPPATAEPSPRTNGHEAATEPTAAAKPAAPHMAPSSPSSPVEGAPDPLDFGAEVLTLANVDEVRDAYRFAVTQGILDADVQLVLGPPDLDTLELPGGPVALRQLIIATAAYAEKHGAAVRSPAPV